VERFVIDGANED